jgi:hypothetical protein
MLPRVTGRGRAPGGVAAGANSMARRDASDRRAHHRCRVEGWPWRIDFSRAACFDTTAMGKVDIEDDDD